MLCSVLRLANGRAWVSARHKGTRPMKAKALVWRLNSCSLPSTSTVLSVGSRCQ